MASKASRIPPTPSTKATASSLTASSSLSSASSDLTVPSDWVEAPVDLEFITSSVDEGTLSIYRGKLNMLYGTTVVMVFTAFLRSLFINRKARDPRPLLIDMLFSVFVSQTVSREWAKVYNTLGGSTLFKQFEIDSTRTADPKVPQSSWVSGSRMNATAVGMLGHLIVECAPPNSSLGKKRASDGTIFNPSDSDGEYATICRETNKGLSADDRACVRIMSEKAGHLVEAICDLLESGGSELGPVLAAVDALKINRF